MLDTANYKIKQYSDTPLDDFLRDFSQDREEFPRPDPPKTDIPEDNQPSEDPPPADQPSATAPEKPQLTEKEIRGKREFTSNFLAKNTDRAMAFLLAMVADTDDIDDWKAEPEDLKDLYECYFEMMQSYGWKGLPPWVNLVACILFTYGPVFREAFKVRGVNRALAAKAAQQEAENAILREKLLQQESKPENTPADQVNDQKEEKTTDGQQSS
jgi:hypothetical protein